MAFPCGFRTSFSEIGAAGRPTRRPREAILFCQNNEVWIMSGAEKRLCEILARIIRRLVQKTA